LAHGREFSFFCGFYISGLSSLDILERYVEVSLCGVAYSQFEASEQSKKWDSREGAKSQIGSKTESSRLFPKMALSAAWRETIFQMHHFVTD
jgi:hypothetical protein